MQSKKSLEIEVNILVAAVSPTKYQLSTKQHIGSVAEEVIADFNEAVFRQSEISPQSGLSEQVKIGQLKVSASNAMLYYPRRNRNLSVVELAALVETVPRRDYDVVLFQYSPLRALVPMRQLKYFVRTGRYGVINGDGSFTHEVAEESRAIAEGVLLDRVSDEAAAIPTGASHTDKKHLAALEYLDLRKGDFSRASALLLLGHRFLVHYSLVRNTLNADQVKDDSRQPTGFIEFEPDKLGKFEKEYRRTLSSLVFGKAHNMLATSSSKCR